MKKQFYVAFALITGGAVTYYIYWDSTKKEKEKEGKVDIDIGLEREQATKNPKKLFFNKNKKKSKDQSQDQKLLTQSSGAKAKKETKNEFAEVIARFQKLDEFRLDAPGTEYKLFYPYVPIHPFKNGSLVKKVEMIHADSGKFNASTGSTYLYDFRAVYKRDKSMMASKMKKAVNWKEYLKSDGHPHAFDTKGSDLMMVEFEGKQYIVPVLRLDRFTMKWQWMLERTGKSSNLAGLAKEEIKPTVKNTSGEEGVDILMYHLEEKEELRLWEL